MQRFEFVQRDIRSVCQCCDVAQALALCFDCCELYRISAWKVVRIAFYSGMRLSEILRLGPSEEVFELHDTKNGESRNVPIHPKIACLARNLPIKLKRGSIQKNFRKARKLVGMEHVHLHDERHSAASNMVNSGVDLFTVGQVLGHKDLRSTQRYSHLKVDTLTAAIRKIG